jgi:hypothetical protein
MGFEGRGESFEGAQCCEGGAIEQLTGASPLKGLAIVGEPGKVIS